jgi:hypothetical protein
MYFLCIQYIQYTLSTTHKHRKLYKLCAKPWCKQSLPSNSTFKNCEHCRNLDRINQQARQTKRNETKTDIQHTTTGQKRGIDQDNQDQHSDRPSHRSKIHNNPEETGEDVFKLDGIELIKDITEPDITEPDITEPDETVSTLNLKDRELLRIKPNTGSKQLLRCQGSF